MTNPLDPALVCTKAHEARRHRPLPPLDDLPLTEDETLPLDWHARTTRAVRLSAVPGLGEDIAAFLIVIIGGGWLAGKVIACALLNPVALTVLGIGP